MKTRTKILAVLAFLALCSICLADELLVPSPWYPTIQAAIDDANDGDTVIVADGTYTGEGNRDIDFLGKAITVRSETGPDNCIIDCNGTYSEPHRGFKFHTAEGPNSVLAGLTITNGHGPYEQLQLPYDEHPWPYRAGGAVFCDNSSPKITNCNITANSADDLGGGILSYHGSPKITNCNITANSAYDLGGGILSYHGSPKITNCTISSNSDSGICCWESNANINNCAITNNSAENAGGISCADSSPTIINCTITGNSARHTGAGMSNRNSNPTITNCTFSGNLAEEGSGMYNYKSSPTITNCTFSNNSAGWFGGGMYNDESSPTIKNCTFSGNSTRYYGGGMSNRNSNPTITNCTFSNNSAGWFGGGMYNDESSPTITNCTFSENSAAEEFGGGIYCWDSIPIITNCTFTGNSADAGGGLFNCDGPITNSIITNNSAEYNGGGLCGCGGPITNCTISGNSAKVHGDGLAYCDGPITNCIIWDNQTEQIYGSPTVTYSNVQGGWEGEGNIDADPLFAFGTDYHLMPSSPCIDAGDPNYVAEPNETDLDANPRIIGERIDMGAYEYNPDAPSIAVSAWSLYFAQDWPKPQPQTLLIRNCGGEPLHWEIAEDCNWLQISPVNGISTGQINEVTITVDPNGLPPAVYSYSFEVRDPNAANNPVTVCVTVPVGEILPVPSPNYPAIQDAIDAADNYDIVLVADGNYTGEGNKNLDFRGKSITVCSENGPNNCIIDCENSGRGFYFQNQETENSIVDGFTITNGYSDSSGGGIYCYRRSSPTIRNCTFRRNSAPYGGGMCNVDQSSPTLTNCTFSSNSAVYYGGGMCNLESSPRLTNCMFSGNLAKSGGGMCNQNSSPTLANCTFTGNSAYYGGGMENLGNRNPTLTNCNITGNSAEYYGGGIYYYGSYYGGRPIITNCTITGNSTGYYGGGIYCGFLSSPTITNCNITSNSAGYYGGGIYCYGGRPIITKCTITGNSADDNGGGICCWCGRLIITKCIITGNSAANGGGIFNHRGNPTITNCAFSGNSAAKYGSGIEAYGSSLTLKNSILWDNASKQRNEIYLGIYTDPCGISYPSTATIQYTDVECGHAAVYVEPGCTLNWGLGNIDANPCFLVPGYYDTNGTADDANDDFWIDGDYHLLPYSPCIDAGDPNYIPEPNETDLDGNPRVNGGRIDMGAYESIMHEARLCLWPRVINRKSRQLRIMAWLRLPKGVAKDQIDKDVPLILYPGGIKATRQFVFQNRRRGTHRTSIFAFFDKAELMDAIDIDGRVQLMVLGHLLKPGQYFYGSDTIRIIARRLPWPRPPYWPPHHRH